MKLFTIGKDQFITFAFLLSFLCLCVCVCGFYLFVCVWLFFFGVCVCIWSSPGLIVTTTKRKKAAAKNTEDGVAADCLEVVAGAEGGDDYGLNQG